MINNKRDDSHLEPRVAKLEAGLEILTKNVGDLTANVERISNTINTKFDALNIGLVQAQAPKRPDWSLFISIGFFIMALGPAVFWPLNKTAQDNKAEIVNLSAKFDEHQKLELHPVGQAKISNMAERLTEIALVNKVNIDNLDKKLQREAELITIELKTQISNTRVQHDREISDLGNRILGRLNDYDQNILNRNEKDLDELRRWRLGELKSKP